ncbi:MAG: phage replisome organizer N-terminal domain-containing protein [Clostridia bacterium]|nr:phage replisome organizer N-terminal domain-containing protein [Clostridia bacterium]
MSDNKKFYWLKLKEDFFDEKQIKYLRKLPDGDKLVIAYLKMQLKSLRTEGLLKYDKILPSSEEELAMILDEDENIIKFLISALLQVKAIEKLDDGSFYMIAMQELIGKEGKSAERVRNFRERQKQKLLQSNTNVTKCNTEIELEKEIEIEKEIDADKKISEITKCYEDNIGMITPAAAELIFGYIDDFKDYRIIIEAIKTATTANIRNAKYISGILRSWLNKGYKVLADIQNEQNRKQEKKDEQQKQNYKEIDTSILTEEEYADIVRGKTTYEEILKQKGVQNE